MKKNTIFVLLLLIATVSYSQNIRTAAAFFSEVSEKYAAINDYMVKMTIKIGSSSTQYGTATFKRPDMLRINFSSPAEQVIIFNGETLSIYLPNYRTILTQDIEKDPEGSSPKLATPQGLSLMKRAYTIQYEQSAEPIPLEENSSEQVVALVMNRKSASETFKRLRVLIYPKTKLIRRIEAVSLDGTKITFNFTDYRTNIGVSSKNFVFDGPPTAKALNDFLFVE